MEMCALLITMKMIMAEICVKTIMEIDFCATAKSSMWQSLNLTQVVFYQWSC